METDEKRLKALELAVYAGNGLLADSVVKTAQAFFDFLTAKPEPAKSVAEGWGGEIKKASKWTK